MESPVIKHSVLVSGHKTSLTLEEEFWNSLQEIAGERRKTVSRLITSIDARRKEFAICHQQQGRISFVTTVIRSSDEGGSLPQHHRAFEFDRGAPTSLTAPEGFASSACPR
jgi:hypothetical protein